MNCVKPDNCFEQMKNYLFQYLKVPIPNFLDFPNKPNQTTPVLHTKQISQHNENFSQIKLLNLTIMFQIYLSNQILTQISTEGGNLLYPN